MTWSDFVPLDWRGYLEVLVLWVGIYYAWRSIRGTRGARVLMGLALLILFVATIAGFFHLPVLGWMFRNVTTAFIFTLIVIFQPEVRRALAAIGSKRLFASASSSTEMIEVLTETTFDLANRQLGALLAIECDQNLEHFAESGQEIDCKFSPPLVVSLFFPKTPLHDGGLIIRNDRVLSASCTFPVSQRVDLDRTLGMRHRAALGLCEESDAVVIVVSEETGIVSICHRAIIERNFTPETFKRRLSELLLLDEHETAQAPLHRPLGSETPFPGSGIRAVGGRAEEPGRDRLAS
jgi:diadenylate cyclase